MSYNTGTLIHFEININTIYMRGAGQVPSHTFPLSRDPTHFQLPGQPASLSRTEGHLSTNKILTVAMFMDWTGEAGDQMMMDGHS